MKFVSISYTFIFSHSLTTLISNARFFWKNSGSHYLTCACLPATLNIFSDTVNIDHKKEFDVNKKSYLYHQRKLNVSPEKWDLIMFPSNLNHSVNQNINANKNRYSLAFNSFATGQLGASSSIMFLDKNKKYD